MKAGTVAYAAVFSTGVFGGLTLTFGVGGLTTVAFAALGCTVVSGMLVVAMPLTTEDPGEHVSVLPGGESP